MSETLHLEIKRMNNDVFVSAEIGLDEISGNTPSLPDAISVWKKKVYGRLMGGAGELFSTRSPDKSDVNIGTELIRLLPGEIRDQISLRFSEPGILPIDLKITDMEWSDLPWEACVHADWSALKMPDPVCKLVVIRTPIRQTLTWPEIKHPIKILIAGSNPKMEPTPNFEAEVNEIETGLRKGLGDAYDSECIIKKEAGINLLDLGGLLQSFEPTIVHLVSHGGHANIQLQDTNWDAVPAYGEDLNMILAQLKEKHNLTMLVSTACLALSDDTKNNKNGLGKFLASKIPVTIGMQFPILEAHVELFTFTRELYFGIGRSLNILQAFAHARDILFRKYPQSPAWISPVIYQGSIELKSVFTQWNLNTYAATKSVELYKLILGLRASPELINLWDSCLILINDSQRIMLDSFLMEENNIDLQITLGGNFENMRLLIKEIRNCLTTGKQMLRSKEIELSLKYGFGKIHSDLLDNLDAFLLELKKLARV